MTESTRSVDLVRLADGRFEHAADRVAVEAALEVRLNGHPFAVIMRTPGADADLVAGFLLSEGVIRSADDLHRLDRPDTDGVLNVVLSRSRAEILPDLLEGRRNVAQNSSCGMCGRRTLESLEIDRPPLVEEWRLDPTVLAGLPAALRRAQHAFDETGGLHAAGLFDLDGRLQSSAEDVGRHNAVDKLLGRALMAGQLPLSRSALVVSGRSSFEIVQKAFIGAIPLVAAVSAPSSLAVDLANRTGITLLGFVRDDRFNIYTHPSRALRTDPGTVFTSAPSDTTR
ncbi:MAG TPA: formate dehydrogenase accessory sulfurtransferase FdhD [Vicinamibacterales bacterium]|nr:formate dehydrogenase accessory sulfurtransferase FdhD [Vicinamibacterales bacterium]